MTAKALRTDQEILGYTLKEHIGDGGYGEVWTAEAPGGLTKAIKFIYGFHDEARAQRELKSLNHIKELRHAFLLSLERIDIVDGRLVIVTELADYCLSDRYEACVEERLVGIPRKELVGYIREAADALDYMGTAHSLQHLDIKPENLLLVSGHIKVADFGLVKDIQDCTQSVMGGLTPAYAAPELFDGRPTMMSDQYSLAIVYQEMLTGQRPFSGTTPAQLAAQHIHCRPNLKPLPRGDQAAVSRALSKNPEHRYPNCTAFIDDIISSEKAAPAPRRENRSRKSRTAEDTDRDQTLVLGDLPTSRSSEPVVKLPSFQFIPEDACTHPTLFVGVGGLGTRVLRAIKGRMHEQLAVGEALPAFQFLAIDVDQDDLFAASRANRFAGLTDTEICDIPLRRPDQYRKDKSLDLSWISRRWIFNVPRSRKTEGIRPLGRLAFVDNSEKLYKKFDKMAARCRDDAQLQQTAERIGLPSATRPRIYLIGAISGGVASGCLHDVAYAARSAFGEIGIDEVDIVGILAHSAGRTNATRSLGAANTYAFLRELHHYRKHGYPGDDASDLGEFSQAPFDATYLIHFGDTHREEDLQDRTERLAEYIFLDTTTSCNAANRIVRDGDEKEDQVRTFGLATIDTAIDTSTSKLQKLLCDQLVKKWSTPDEGGFDYEAAVRKLRASLQLSPSNLFEIVTNVISDVAGLNPLDLSSQVAKNAAKLKLTPSTLEAVPNEIESSIRGWLLVRSVGVGNYSVQERVTRTLSRLAKDKVEDLEKLVTALVNEPGFRIAKAIQCVDEFQRVLREYMEVSSKAHEENVAELKQHVESWKSDEILRSADLPAKIERFAYVTSRDEITQLVLRFVQFLLDETEGVKAKVMQHAAGLKRLGNAFPVDMPPWQDDLDEGFKEHFENYFVGDVASHAAQLVNQLDDCLQDGFFNRVGGFWGALGDEDNREIQSLATAINKFARRLVRNQISQIDVDDVIRAGQIDQDSIIDWMRPSVESATPYILDCGGEARLMLNVPKLSEGALCSAALELIFDESVTVVPSTKGSMMVTFEVQNIPLSNIALRLLEEAPEAVECVGRLISRTDVEWGPLTGIA